MTIQEAARRSGLSAYTLRYYERIGLIHSVGRDGSGHRDYAERDLAWLGFLTKLRSTGMPIADMCRYAELARMGPHTGRQRRELLEAHREKVRARIAELTQDLEVLDYKIESYRGRDEQAHTR
ncbi:MerR family transcriptional regulator [Nonomuraea sp. NPDC050536]|uniref:MerR family transcriptional regulator n=1 Tax=Nonomuraea sp. NPDC050536 TaxID=3364366 RepID=UPI0037C5900F